jgi:hypothetical protein
MNGHRPASEPEVDETPFYSCVDVSEVTDTEVLTLYAIYRNVSHGRTLEPYESLLQEQHAQGRGKYTAGP